MAQQTKIEWCDATWNPTSGCTPISDGCRNCWAKRMAHRQRGRNGYPADDPFRVTFHHERIDQPLRWKKPRRIAVSLMGDLFHDDVPFEWIDKVFAVINAAWVQMPIPQDVMTAKPWHTFLILTKRPERMCKYMLSRSPRFNAESHPIIKAGRGKNGCLRGHGLDVMNAGACVAWPPSNAWLGVSIENQQTADERIPWLLKCPAAVRFVSAEPLLGQISFKTIGGIELTKYEGGGRLGQDVLDQKYQHIDWVIAGGESGSGARPCHPDWIRSLRDQCNAVDVPFFFKQWGEWTPNAEPTPHIRYQLVESSAGGRAVTMHRVGKKNAGRLFDGREWNEMPGTGIGG
jgi:protein gp37